MKNLKKKTVGVLFGGQSSEHEVSIITGEMILAELKKQSYNTLPIYITRKGQWVISEKIGELKFFKGNRSEIENRLAQSESYFLDINKSVQLGKLVFKQKKIVLAKEKIVDIAFPAFHGQMGEDGTIQGLLQFLNVPYVGNNVVASAITMDKALSLSLCQTKEIPTVNFYAFFKKEQKETSVYCDEIESRLVYPLFIKPARFGSSIGISRVANREGLQQAIEVAFSYDQKIVVEEAVNNLSDLTCAIRERESGKLQTSLVQESVFKGDFFNFSDKYLEDGGAQLGKNDKKLVIPAEIDEELVKKIKQLTKKVFNLFNCNGMARVDFLYDNQAKKLYVGEINTIPGTLYHHLWKATGVNLAEVIDELIKVSLQHYKNKNRVGEELKMEILMEANSLKLQYDK